MKVFELIQILKDMPQDFEVVGWSEGNARLYPDSVCVLSKRYPEQTKREVAMYEQAEDAPRINHNTDNSFPVISIFSN